MSTESVTSQPDGAQQTLGPGTVVGGRFQIEEAVRSDAISRTFRARDQKTQRPIAIRTLSPIFGADKAAFGPAKEAIKAAARIKHRNLAATYGVGTHGADTHFIASEWVGGTTLKDLVAQRHERPLSVRGVYNIVAHVCKALGAVDESGCHGGVRPGVVWVSKSGRVKLDELGICRGLAQVSGWSSLDEAEQAFLAPEIKSGGAPTSASDIFGLGALIYVMLTGRSPTDDFVAPSRAHPEATAELDAALMRCLAGDPAARYGNPQELLDALLPLLAEAPEAHDEEDFGVDVEIDVDVATSLAPPAPAGASAPPAAVIPPVTAPPPAPAPAAPPPAVAALGTPAVAAPRAAPAPISAPGLPPPPSRRATPDPATAGAGAGAGAASATGSEMSLDQIIAGLTQNDAPRWMAVKDGMDHGPFTARELVRLIVEGEVQAEHGVLNMDTNERKPLAEYPEFTDFVEQYQIRKAEMDHAAALERSDKVEKRSKLATSMILAGAVAVVLAVVVGYVMNRNAAKRRERAAEVDVAALYKGGEVEVKGTAGILKYTRRAGGGRAAGGGAPSPGGFTSYEQAMNVAIDMGSAKQAGGERQLTPQQVAGVMDRKLNALWGCVRGGVKGKITIDMAIAGGGNVLGATVKGGDGAFKSCILGKVRRLRFPGVPAPRTPARYSFVVD